MKGVTQADSEWPVIICAPVTEPLHYADNLVEACKFCGCAVQLRPHNPVPHHAACVECWNARVTKEDTLMVSEETLREVALERARTKGKH